MRTRRPSAAAVTLKVTVFTLMALWVFSMAGSTALGASTPVNLKTAGQFAILAHTGITNVPTSVITGNVGLSPTTGAAITGLTCAEVTGTIYTVNDVTATIPCSVMNPVLLLNAKNDVEDAFTQAASYARTTIPTELGPSTPDPLGPGVYTSASTTFEITGTLTLNAGGDPNAIWIFYMGSTAADALSTSVGSRVVLQNGAQACNVFWAVAGGATLLGGVGTLTTFVGTIMAGTSITVGANVTIDGRLLARTGNVTLIQDTITRSDCAPVTTTTTTTGTGTTTTTTGTGTTTTSTGTGTTTTGTGTATPTPFEGAMDELPGSGPSGSTFASLGIVALSVGLILFAIGPWKRRRGSRAIDR